MDFLVYFILDTWSYATLFEEPFDNPSDPLTWTRQCLLIVAGVVIPLVMPRPFRPTKPDVSAPIQCTHFAYALTCVSFTQSRPSPLETVSILSRVTYSFMDRIVFYAFKVPDLKVDSMPEIPDSAMATVLAEQAIPVGNFST